MSLASASVSEHGFDAWLAHKRSRRTTNRLIVAATVAVLAWCFWDTIMFDTDWARMGGALGIGGTLERLAGYIVELGDEGFQSIRHDG